MEHGQLNPHDVDAGDMQQEVQACSDHVEANRFAANLDVLMGTDCKAVYAARAARRIPRGREGRGQPGPEPTLRSRL